MHLSLSVMDPLTPVQLVTASIYSRGEGEQQGASAVVQEIHAEEGARPPVHLHSLFISLAVQN
jgi:hypothetical protein